MGKLCFSQASNPEPCGLASPAELQLGIHSQNSLAGPSNTSQRPTSHGSKALCPALCSCPRLSQALANKAEKPEDIPTVLSL